MLFQGILNWSDFQQEYAEEAFFQRIARCSVPSKNTE